MLMKLTPGPISPTFYAQLLPKKIPSKKYTDELSVFLLFWDLIAQKLLVKTWVKLTPGSSNEEGHK